MSLPIGILSLAFIAAPPVGLAWQGRRARRRRSLRPLAGFAVSMITGSIVGIIFAIAYAYALDGRVRTSQILITTYFAIGLLLILRGLNWLLTQVIDRQLKVAPRHVRRGRYFTARRSLAISLRLIALYAVGLPLLIAVVIVYRPRVQGKQDPTNEFGFVFEPVHFEAVDGGHVAGWWIPAQEPSGKIDKSNRTVILCHGFFSDKSGVLPLARDLVPRGFNVLAIDLRAHGESGGQLMSFGAHERDDVLGAVKWIEAVHPDGGRHIYGVGVGLGSAALISAAADAGSLGQSIEAIVAFGAYDTPESVVDTWAKRCLLPPLDSIAVAGGLPMSGLLVGADLRNQTPLHDVQALWPRPILYVHAMRDRFVTFDAGQRLEEKTLQPRYYWWLPGKDDHELINDDAISRTLFGFLSDPKQIL